MSGAQHTPGPWTVDNMLGEVTSEYGTVAVIMAQDDYEKPNLDLVAAAPDLLAALRVFAECADQLDGDEYTPRAPDNDYAKFRLLTDHYRAARAAVAKATGK